MNAARRIWLCADDYGLTRPINTAIRELIERGRINATSVMVVTPGFDPAEAAALLKAAGARTAIGLHVTLTAPFRPREPTYSPVRDGNFLPLGDTLRAAFLRRLHRPALKSEVTSQLNAFTDAFGRPPDFVDGHQHVQLFPQIRDALLDAVADLAPNAWVRQCGRAPTASRRTSGRKALLFDILSVRFRRKARRRALAINPAFAGSYDFAGDAGYAELFPEFLDGLPDGGLVMCHPGVVDAELKRLDTLTTMRERELAYFQSDEFPRTLATKGVALA